MFLIRKVFACFAITYIFICSLNFVLTSAAASGYPVQSQAEVTSDPNSYERRNIVRRDNLVNFPNNIVTRSKSGSLLLRLIR